MYMPYTTNPHMPRVRRDAVRLVSYRGWSIRKAARHIGVEPSTVSRWVRRDPTGGWRVIPTLSSRPHSHPRQLSSDVITKILEIRHERDQCAEIVQHRLRSLGIEVSVSSVKRVLKRYGISRFSRWKKWHQYPPRPLAERPGILVELDSMREGLPAEHLYAYALIDVYSRWAYADVAYRIGSRQSIRFIDGARAAAPFQFQTLQSDHGPEFSKWFTKVAGYRGFAHRHSRVRTPTDNGHVERFIRTLQHECLNRASRSLRSWQKEIPEYLHYYNSQRPHMGLQMRTPLEVLQRY